MIQKQFARLTSITIFLLLAFIVTAQPDCRSIISSHLTPIGQSSLSWATELTLAGGLMPDREIANGSIYGALDYSKNKSQFYLEGAYKIWYNSASNPDGAPPQSTAPDYNKPTRYHWGFRELYYRYGSAKNYVKPGVQSITSEDYFLLDERALGLSASKNLNAFTLTGNIGTVTQRLARYQDVCGNRHIYNIIHQSQYNFVSENPGESNFGLITLKWRPEDKNNDNDTGNTSDDEFSSLDEFSSSEFGESPSAKVKIDNAGILLYEEFGEAFHTYKYYFGAFSEIVLFKSFRLKTELIDQYIPDEHCLAYMLELETSHSWNNGSSSLLDIGYLGKIDIDQGAHFYPAFANLFKGEVMRLDAVNMPLAYASLKHFFPGKSKFTAEVNAVAQIEGSESKEIDTIIGMKFLGHARLTAIGSYITSELLEDNYWMAKLELRVAF